MIQLIMDDRFSGEFGADLVINSDNDAANDFFLGLSLFSLLLLLLLLLLLSTLLLLLLSTPWSLKLLMDRLLLFFTGLGEG